MARTRNIKPSFFTNDKLGDCQPLARLLFAGLWTIADRAGRLESRPKKIKAEILPYDECSVEKLLSELSIAGFIHIYKLDQNEYIQILNFDKHQHPHMKEPESTIQAPDLSGSNPSLTLIPYTLTLNPITHAPTLSGDFELFWQNYPSGRPKGNKQEAKKKYERILKSGTLEEEVLEGVYRYSDFCAAGNYNQHAVTWLNQAGWKEEWHPAGNKPLTDRERAERGSF